MAGRLKSRSSERDAVRRSDGADARAPLPLHPGARLTGRVALALGLLGLALWTAADFLPALIWATILAVALWPLYVPLAARVSAGPSTLSALLFTLLVALILFLPLALAVYQIAQQSDQVAAWIAQSRDNGIAVPEWIARLPIAADAVQQWWRENLAEPRSVAMWLQSLNLEKAGDLIRAFGGQLLHRLFMFFVTLLALFAFLRNGDLIGRRLAIGADRIFGDPGEGLVEKMVDAVRGTVNGTVMVAVTEGLLIGIAYLVAGVPNPVLFTILTIAFAMLPFGAWAAFSVASLTLLLGGGSGVAAFGVFAWGAVVMLAGDHFVWPTLVGGFLGMGEHDVLVEPAKIKFMNEPVRSATAPAPSDTKAPARTEPMNTRPAAGRADSAQWYPDHGVLSATKEQLKAMPQFKYSSYN